MNTLKLAVALFASFLATSDGAPPLEEGPFSGINLSNLPKDQARVIREASEDFVLVTRGKKPLHAVFDSDAPLPTDGGTTFYLGDGYKLSIIKSLSSFGDLHGYLFGPYLTFDSEFATGNSDAVIGIRFYTSEQLAALKSVDTK